MAAANLPVSHSPEANFDPNDDIDWHVDELLYNHPRQLRGTNLVRVALHYSNKELLKEINEHRSPVWTKNNFTHYLSNAIDDYAIAHDNESHRYRDRYDLLRKNNLKKIRGINIKPKVCTMPAGVCLSHLPTTEVKKIG